MLNSCCTYAHAVRLLWLALHQVLLQAHSPRKLVATHPESSYLKKYAIKATKRHFISATSSNHAHDPTVTLISNHAPNFKDHTTYLFPLLHQLWHPQHGLPPLLQPPLHRPLPPLPLDPLPDPRPFDPQPMLHPPLNPRFCALGRIRQ